MFLAKTYLFLLRAGNFSRFKMGNFTCLSYIKHKTNGELHLQLLELVEFFFYVQSLCQLRPRMHYQRNSQVYYVTTSKTVAFRSEEVYTYLSFCLYLVLCCCCFFYTMIPFFPFPCLETCSPSCQNNGLCSNGLCFCSPGYTGRACERG